MGREDHRRAREGEGLGMESWRERGREWRAPSGGTGVSARLRGDGGSEATAWRRRGEGWWGPQGQNRLFTAQLTVTGWKTRRSVMEGTKVELDVK